MKSANKKVPIIQRPKKLPIDKDTTEPDDIDERLEDTASMLKKAVDSINESQQQMAERPVYDFDAELKKLSAEFASIPPQPKIEDMLPPKKPGIMEKIRAWKAARKAKKDATLKGIIDNKDRELSDLKRRMLKMASHMKAIEKAAKDEKLRNELAEKRMQKSIAQGNMYDPVMLSNMKRWTFWGMIRKWRKNRNDMTAFLINMELVNGNHVTVIATPVDGAFTWNGGTYVIDEAFKYYNMSAAMWCLDYHEGIPVPVKREIPASEIKKSIGASGISDIEMAFNPMTLSRWLQSKIIEAVIRSAEFMKEFKKTTALMMVTMIVSVLTFLLLLYHSGIFSGAGQALGIK